MSAERPKILGTGRAISLKNLRLHLGPAQQEWRLNLGFLAFRLESSTDILNKSVFSFIYYCILHHIEPAT